VTPTEIKKARDDLAYAVKSWAIEDEDEGGTMRRALCALDALQSELAAARGKALEEAAQICERANAGLMPPDGGSPTPREMLANVAADIRALSPISQATEKT
jgi:hypothetical protein